MHDKLKVIFYDNINKQNKHDVSIYDKCKMKTHAFVFSAARGETEMATSIVICR